MLEIFVSMRMKLFSTIFHRKITLGLSCRVLTLTVFTFDLKSCNDNIEKCEMYHFKCNKILINY